MHLGCRLLRESAKRLELNSSCSRNIVRKFTEDTSKNNAMPNIAKESASRNSDSHPPSVGDNHQSIDSKYDHSNYFKSSLDSTKRAATAFTHTTQVMSHDLKEYLESIESSLMIKINQKNKSRFRLYVISALMSIIWVTVVFGENIRNTITEKTADIAKGTLENRELKIQTQELAILVIQAILNDKDIAGHAASFLREVSSSEETQRALVQLTIHVLQHEESLKQVTILAKKLIDNLSKDPETIQQVSSLMVDALADPRIRASLVELIKDLSADPAIIDAVANMSIDVLNKNNVLDASSKLLAESSQIVLSDSSMKNHSRSFVADVIGDDMIQKEGGDALWNSITHALTPGLTRIAGVGLLALSVGIANLAISPY